MKVSVALKAGYPPTMQNVRRLPLKACTDCGSGLVAVLRDDTQPIYPQALYCRCGSLFLVGDIDVDPQQPLLQEVE